ncbi:MAG: hypothetical protein A2Z78_00380 [Candidatus Nealsonbacteria bacterium RBG_13_36_15]|uniref:DUF4064 domain-containing protein n=1 Tax=Candidatus Nealsonbacteria bacterium RBG_13_36_15 TaxID=1801660 RepID=A0A1G2DWD4_9BACT|nr:MAG: hypothetical protein A2Z78_00380 [Candidatus Nealsonbacteria bacterium RBG_13_36_15]
MNDNLNNQQPKSDPKGKAIASFVLGIINVISFCIVGLFIILFLGIDEGSINLTYKGNTFLSLGPNERLFLGYLQFALTITLGLIGLILGRIGLKSSKKRNAIIGIILNGTITMIFLYILFFV